MSTYPNRVSSGAPRAAFLTGVRCAVAVCVPLLAVGCGVSAGDDRSDSASTATPEISTTGPASPAAEGCRGTATHPVARAPYAEVGSGPLRAGPVWGAAAQIDLRDDVVDDQRSGARLYFVLAQDGPEVVRVSGRRVDGAGEVLFAGAGVRALRRVLVLRRSELARQGGVVRPGWYGSPGVVSLPSPGCYVLTASWSARERWRVRLFAGPDVQADGALHEGGG